MGSPNPSKRIRNISSNGFERNFRRDLASSSVKILVASTKSSNIAGIPSFGGLLGLIRKRLVEFRLDFLAFQNWSDPDFSKFGWHSSRLRVCAVVAPGLVDSGSLVTENGHRVFLWVPQQFPDDCVFCQRFLLYRLGSVSRAMMWPQKCMMERLNNYFI